MRFLPRDLVLTAYAVVVAVLGIFVVLGPTAAVVGGGIIVLVFALGAIIYGVLALAARWADR